MTEEGKEGKEKRINNREKEGEVGKHNIFLFLSWQPNSLGYIYM